MKKSIFSLVLMLVGMTAWAQEWTDPGENAYQGSTPVYVQVNVNGQSDPKTTVAAFIDGECRSVAYGANQQAGGQLFYLLRVWGDNDDLNKTITFKIDCGGIVYVMNKTATFTGETYTPVPLVLNVDKPTGVSLTSPLNIVAKLPYSYDLTNDITFSYQGFDDSGAPVDYAPLGESTMETELTYFWEYADATDFFTIKDNQLIATMVTGEEAPKSLSLNIPELGLATRTSVIISEPVIPVKSIECSMQEVEMTIHQNLYRLEELTSAITVLPADASNKGYSFVAADSQTESVFSNGSFTDGGTYTINIVSDADASIYTTIQVTVKVPVESISLNTPSTTFQAIVGDNVYDLIAPYVEVYPANADNQEFSLEIPAEASDAIVDNVAYMPGEYLIHIVSDENPEIKTEVTVIISQIEAPESIEMEIGQSYNLLLEGLIKIYPETNTYDITPATATDAEAFNNGEAIKAGTYTLEVICKENDRLKTQIKVTVLTPIKITYPASLTVSKLKDTELTLTLVEGDGFNPELVEVVVDVMEAAPGVTEAVTCEPADASGLVWNLRASIVGYHNMRVLYDGREMPNDNVTYEEYYATVFVPVEIPFNNAGWDWIYYPGTFSLMDESTGNYQSWMNNDVNNRIIEIRSQSNLLYNDVTLGLFGTITELSNNDGMYKVKASYENTDDAVIVGTDAYWERNSEKTIVKGYNWIGYPNEWSMTVENLNEINTMATDGDLIIGKDGFAEFDAASNGWVGSDGFYFKPGKGYLYYRNSEDRMSNSSLFDYNPYNVEPNMLMMSHIPTASTEESESVWKYDAGQFADNMAMVAVLPQLEYPADYTIGAFVGDECRGKGSAVLGGKMMINVAGKAGETVTFRLHNELTGEFVDLNETVTYAQRVGSLKKPVTLTSDAIATSISETIAPDVETEGIFDLSGRRVETMNAKGIFIVKTIENGKIVARKVIKK